MGAGEDIMKRLDAIEAKLDQVLARSGSTGGGSTTASPAPESDLDGQWGNPKVRFDPKDWTGESFKGQTFSDAPPRFLDLLAAAYEFFAKKNVGKDDKKAGYDLREAGRAKGWALRKRAGWKAPAPLPTGPDAGW